MRRVFPSPDLQQRDLAAVVSFTVPNLADLAPALSFVVLRKRLNTLVHPFGPRYENACLMWERLCIRANALYIVYCLVCIGYLNNVYKGRWCSVVCIIHPLDKSLALQA